MRQRVLNVNSIPLLIGLPLFLLVLFASSVDAGWDEAKAAADRGEHESAFKQFLVLAESGHASAQSTVGVMYYNGEGVEQDLGAALVWLNLAANQGYSVAQFNLGVMYDSGDGVEQDFADAFNWYYRAAVQGHTAAQYNLGAMYSQGEGVAKDKVRAHMWYHISALNGNENAVESREVLKATMTDGEYARAIKMVGECVNSKYKEC